jgi:hypothetical protein
MSEERRPTTDADQQLIEAVQRFEMAEHNLKTYGKDTASVVRRHDEVIYEASMIALANAARWWSLTRK